jgi:hypothetical protein
MIPRLLPALCVVLLVLDASLPAMAQANIESTSAGPTGSQSGYTFQANSRVVLTDVTVTDRQGNPVHGLKASDFRVFDNNKPEDVASFAEHSKDTTAPAPQLVSAPGVYSNDYLARPPRVLNILFLDLNQYLDRRPDVSELSAREVLRRAQAGGSDRHLRAHRRREHPAAGFYV